MPTKVELESLVEEVENILSRAYEPESSREQLAEAMGQALDLLSPEDDEDIDDLGEGEADEDED